MGYVRAGHKPSSVPVSVTLYGTTIIHLKDMGCPIPLATNPEARTGRPQMLPYLVLLQVGFT